METRKVAETGVLLALALVLSFFESLIPAFVAIPGIKLGLANIVVLFSLYRQGFKVSVLISVLRVILSAVLFGSVASFAYSLTGALLSICVMALLKKTRLFGTVAVSVTGAVVHNLGQIAVACFLLGRESLVYYLPVLLVSGVASGVVIGIVAAVLDRRIGTEAVHGD